MAEAKKDENGVSTITALSEADGVTVLNITANPVTHLLDVCQGDTGTNFSPDNNARRDENKISTLLAVSSGDGVTPVALYVDPVTKELLIQTT